MKISTETLAVLTNFQSINQSLVLKPGELVKTLSDDKCILATAKTSETFPSDFGIYDLAQFINNVNTLGTDTEIDFDGNQGTFKNNGFEVSFRACKPELITQAPDKDLPMDDIKLSVVLEGTDLKKFLKLANMNDLKNIALENRDGKIYISADDGSDTSNRIEHSLGDTDKENCRVKFLTTHLKMIPGTYSVESTESFAKFTSQNGDLNYWIVAQK